MQDIIFEGDAELVVKAIDDNASNMDKLLRIL